MDSGLAFPLILFGCIIVVILLRYLATKDHIVGRIIRAYWNTCCVVTSFIPFLSWTTKIPFMGPVKNHRLSVFVKDMTDISSGIAEGIIEEMGKSQIYEMAVKEEVSKRGGTNICVSSDGQSVTYTKNGIDYTAKVDFK